MKPLRIVRIDKENHTIIVRSGTYTHKYALSVGINDRPLPPQFDSPQYQQSLLANEQLLDEIGKLLTRPIHT